MDHIAHSVRSRAVRSVSRCQQLRSLVVPDHSRHLPMLFAHHLGHGTRLHDLRLHHVNRRFHQQIPEPVCLGKSSSEPTVFSYTALKRLKTLQQVPLSKLTYSAYLVHTIVILYFNATQEHPMHIQDSSMVSPLGATQPVQSTQPLVNLAFRFRSTTFCPRFSSPTSGPTSSASSSSCQ